MRAQTTQMFGPRTGRRSAARRTAVFVTQIALLAAVVAILQFAVGSADSGAALFLAKPSDVWISLTHWTGIPIWHHIAVTLQHLIGSFVFGSIAGIVIALGVWALKGRSFGRAIESVIAIVNNVPRIVLVPLFILWFGIHGANVTAFGAVAVTPLTFYFALAGLRATPERLLQGTAVLGASGWDRVRLVVLPAARPLVVAGVLLAIPQALVSVIAGEMLIGGGGLGDLVAQLGGLYKAPPLLAACLIAGVLGVIVHEVVKLASHSKLVGYSGGVTRGSAGLG